MADVIDIFDRAAAVCPDRAISPLDLVYDVKGDKAVRTTDGQDCEKGADSETVSTHAHVVLARYSQ